MRNKDFSDIGNSFYQNIEENTISLVLFADGAKFGRSNNSSYWAMFASIIDLPPIMRDSFANIIILLTITATKLNLQLQPYNNWYQMELN
jgi:hypothetical protein